MPHHKYDEEKYIEKLQKFYQLDWVRHTINLQKRPNFWSIIEYGQTTKGMKRTAHETRLSKMLRWLLDPNDNHQLGNVFAKKLLRTIGVTNYSCTTKNEQVEVLNEYKDIDVFYQDIEQNCCLAIEVKQYAKEGISEEGESQLDRYKQITDEIAEKTRSTAHYIYLTPLQMPPTNDAWHIVGYEQLIEIIEEVLSHSLPQSSSPYKEDIEKIVRDFKDELQRTVNIANKDNEKWIDAQLSKKEKEYTSLLAFELEQKREKPNFQRLAQKVDNEKFPLKQLIVLTEKCLSFQDKTPNDAVGLLMRHIYNELSDDQQLALDLSVTYSNKERLSNLSRAICQRYDLEPLTIQLTSSKGQGIHLKAKDARYRIYLSGDAKGQFPNDSIHLVRRSDGSPITTLVKEEGDVRINATLMKSGQFQVTEESIARGGVYSKEGDFVSIEPLIKNYILPALQELDEKAKQWRKEELL